MKENYQIYLPYQFHWRAHSLGGDAQLSHKKMKSLFLSNMSKSRRLTSTFFPISRGHATLHLAVSVGPSVCPSQIFLKLRSFFELPLLPNRPRLDSRVSGLVLFLPKMLI